MRCFSLSGCPGVRIEAKDQVRRDCKPGGITHSSAGGVRWDWDFDRVAVTPAAFDPGSWAGGRDPMDADGTDEWRLGRGAGVQGEGFGAETQDLGGRAFGNVGGQVEVEGSGVLTTAGPDGAIAEEVGEPGMARRAVELLGWARLDQTAGGEGADVGGLGEEFARVMGDVEDGEVVVLLEFAEKEAELTAEGGVEVGKWFVEEEQGGLRDEGAAEGSAGGFAGGEGGGHVPESVRKADSVGHDLGPGGAIGGGEAAETEWEFQLGLQVEVGQQARRLGDPAALASFRAEGSDVGSVGEDLAGVRGFESGDEAKGGGFAAAGRAGEQVMAPGLDFDGQVPDGRDGSEPFAQSLELDARHGRKGQAPTGSGEGILRSGGAGV